MVQKLVDFYRASVIGHPRLALALVFLLTLAMAAGLPNLKLDASSDALTLEHDADLDYFREMNQRYESSDFLLVTFRPHEDLFSDDSLQLLQQLTDELGQIPGVTETKSLLDAPLLYSPKVSLGSLTEGRTILAPDVDRGAAKQEYLTSPIYRDMLLGPDGQTTAVMLSLALDHHYIEMVRHRDALRLKRTEGELTAAEEAELERVTQQFRDYRTAQAVQDRARVEQVRAVVAKYQDRAQLFVGGPSMITADMVDFISGDLKVFGVGVVLLMIIVISFIFRQFWLVVLPLASAVAAVIVMLGLLAWVDWRMTVISSNFVPLLLIISLAMTIHLVVRYREDYAADPDAPQDELVMKMVRFMAQPCWYSIVTSMVAFMSLVVSNIRPVIDFGWMMTIGLGVVLMLTFVIIPAGLMVVPRGKPVRSDRGDDSSALTLVFSRFTERFPGMVLWLSVAFTLISLYGVSRLEVENRFIDYFHKKTEIYQGLSVIDQNLGGTITLDILLEGPREESGDFTSDDEDGDPFADVEAEADPFAAVDDAEGSDPFAAQASHAPYYWFTTEGLQRIKRVHDYLNSLPEIGKVQSLATAYEVGTDINGSPLNNFELALMHRSLPADIREILIDPYLSEEHNQARITMRVMETYPGLHRSELLQAIHHQLVNDLGFAEEDVRFSGLLVLYNNMLQSLFSSQIITLGAVFFGIMLMFVVLFRSVLLAFIGILPNLLAAGVILGGMGLVGIPLDMMTITVAAITVGIGVDDTIHYVHRFQREFAVDGDYIAAMHRSHASIGRAMFYTSVIIIVGFSVLGLSNFIPTIYFGVLTSFAMLVAMLAALTLLPRLILLTRPLGKAGNPGTRLA